METIHTVIIHKFLINLLIKILQILHILVIHHIAIMQKNRLHLVTIIQIQIICQVYKVL